MPVTRFLGYIEFMNKTFEEQNKSSQQIKVDKLKDTMTKEDRIKYEEEYG